MLRARLLTWYYVSTRRATFALGVRDGRVVRAPPYAIKWTMGRPIDEVLASLEKQRADIHPYK